MASDTPEPPRPAPAPNAAASVPSAGAAMAAPPRGCSNFKLRQTARTVSRFYDRHMATVGLKTSQYSLLSHIATLQPVRPADLAARMALEPSTLTRNLAPLVAGGWVQVGPGADARSRAVTLTAAGAAKRAEAQRAWKQAQLAFNARLGEPRVAQLHALLDDCLARLDEPDAVDDLAD